VSLGFDFSTVREYSAPKSAVTFAPCVYRDEEKERLLHHSISGYVGPVLDLALHTADIPTVECAIDEIQKQHPELGEEQATKKYWEQLEKGRDQVLGLSLNAMSTMLFHLIGLLKHSSFEEEQEWRFVFPIFKDMTKPPKLKFRSRASTLVPYIEYPLSGTVEGTESFRLKEIILGPGSQDEIAFSAVRAFLDSLGIKDVLISQSRIPYRPW
jgi:hypothetical protein